MDSTNPRIVVSELSEDVESVAVNNVDSDDSSNSSTNISGAEKLSRFNDDWTEGNASYDDPIEDDLSVYVRDFRLIKENMSLVIPRLYSTMMFIRYKSSVLRFSYKFSSILIILFSSIITFIEALRANIETTVDEELLITVTTLTLSFIIALTASIVKFFNLQDKIEKLNILNNMLETPYLEASKLLEKLRTRSENEITKKSVKSLRESWEKIIDQYAKPHIDAHNILHPNKVTQYMQKYNTQKKQIDDIDLYNENMRSIRNIEEYIVSLQKDVLNNLHNENNESVHYTLGRLKQLNETLDSLNYQLAVFKDTMSKIYSRDRLYNYKTEIQNIEWWRFKNIKDLLFFNSIFCKNKHQDSEILKRKNVYTRDEIMT